MAEEEREWLKREYIMVICPLAPDAPEEEKQQIEQDRQALIASLHLDTCDIGYLRHLVFGDAA